MTDGRGKHLQARQAERYATYVQARDGGATPADAEQELGVSTETRRRYERSYRQLRGLPPLPRGHSGLRL